MTKTERSEFNKIMLKIQDVKDDVCALKNRSEEGFAFEQNVTYQELDAILNRLDALDEEAFAFFEKNEERYKTMELDIMKLRDELTKARKSKDYISNR